MAVAEKDMRRDECYIGIPGASTGTSTRTFFMTFILVLCCLPTLTIAVELNRVSTVTKHIQ